jgi:hypothetical protein
LLDLSKYTGSVSGLEITEVGKPSIYDPGEYYSLIERAIEQINLVNPIKINMVHFWTREDNFEWAANLNNSRFGHRDVTGNPKAKSDIPLSPINWQDKKILNSARELAFYLMMNGHANEDKFDSWLKQVEQE